MKRCEQTTEGVLPGECALTVDRMNEWPDKLFGDADPEAFLEEVLGDEAERLERQRQIDEERYRRGVQPPGYPEPPRRVKSPGPVGLLFWADFMAQRETE